MNIDFKFSNDVAAIVVVGDFICANVTLGEFVAEIKRRKIHKINVSLGGVENWDSSFLVFIKQLHEMAENYGLELKISGLPLGARHMFSMMRRGVSTSVRASSEKLSFVEFVGEFGLRMYAAICDGAAFIGRVCKSVSRMVRGCAQTRATDWFFALDAVGPRAIGIVSLISFLIGLILAFVGAAQLKLFGAQIYVASLVAIASVRIMGAMMTGIIMAGRTAASYAATIGTMQTNDELDALDTMGISKIDFLVLPRVMSITFMMPILTMLADIMAVLGGAFIGVLIMRIPAGEYFAYTMQAIDMRNFSVGIFHGLVYGIIIGLCGCYCGIKCGRDASSVGIATTRAVVSSIVWMVIATGIITFLFEVIGI